ncbi:MAG: UvrD-helicase domain-containing protein, partial [Thermomicrobiales bacterium]
RDVPDPLDGVTPAQREAVTHRGGPLVVIGAAGTGKTRTLLHRHAWLATAGGLAPLLAGSRFHFLPPDVPARNRVRSAAASAPAGAFTCL